MSELKVLPYDSAYQERWDALVMQSSWNGTFLQTRRFLSYHPDGRFHDASCMVARENGELVAVVPAVASEKDGKPFLRSHPGSTFGGIVYHKDVKDTGKLLDIISVLENDWKARYACVELHPTSAMLSQDGGAMLDYCLFHEGYARECELVTYIPLEGRTLDKIEESFSYNKRADLKKCRAKGLTAAPLTTQDEIRAFHDLLALNLEKFGAKPIHTKDELIDFATSRLKDEISFVGVRDAQGVLVAAGCLFYFAQTNILHTQYLATDTRIKGYYPSAFLYSSVIDHALHFGARALSLGTSTFEHGHVLNAGLTQSKENYGASHAVNAIYTKQF